MKKILLIAISLMLAGCVINPHPMSPQERAYWQMQADQNAYDAAHNRGLWAKPHHHRSDWGHHHYSHKRGW